MSHFQACFLNEVSLAQHDSTGKDDWDFDARSLLKSKKNV